MRPINSFVFLILCLLLPGLAIGQLNSDKKRSHFGVCSQFVATKQIYKNELASSSFKPGFSLGVYQHLDFGPRIQLRLGSAISAYKAKGKDYSPTFPADFDPSTGEVDVYKSYLLNTIDVLQFNLPINIRYKLAGTSKHIFISCGVEYRIIIHDKFEAKIWESGVHFLEIDTKPFYKTRNPILASHLELGYEVPWNNKKINVSLVGKYALASQIKGKGQSFYGIYKGHTFDIGIGTCLIF